MLNCKKQKCLEFHRTVMDGHDNGWRKCHMGYVCKRATLRNQDVAYVGLRVKNITPNRCFNESGVLQHKYSEEQMRCLVAQNDAFIASQISIDAINRYIPDLSHSLSKILDSAASNGHYIVESMERNPEERNYTSINSAAITVGMAAIQAKAILQSINIQTFGVRDEKRLPINVYGKFVRASITLRHIWKNARIEPFRGSSNCSYMLTPSFGLMPYLILDNALKYSPKGSVVDVHFLEDESGLSVVVSNTGPYVSAEELERIWNNGYRGELARKVTAEGAGIGLSTVKSILIENKVRANVKSVRIENAKLDGVQMGEFEFRLRIDRSLIG